MKMNFLKSGLLMMSVAMMGSIFSSCSGKEGPSAPSVNDDLSGVDGLVSLTSEMLGDVWDEGYVSSEGYVLAKGLGSLTKAEIDEDDTTCVGVMSADKKTTVYLFIAEDGLPAQLVSGDYTLYFNFLNNETLELTLSNGSTLDYVTSVACDVAALKEALASRNYARLFQVRLASVVELLTAVTIPSQFVKAVDLFRSLCGMQMASDPDATLQDLIDSGVLKEGGMADFVEEVTQEFNDVVVDVKYAIVLWTGKASFKVGGTSCTLSGTIHCASPMFNQYGTYGIVCDTDPDNLYIDSAEYVGKGYQNGISTHFDVDFRGLKANTTYYYRAYYQFNSDNHGELSFKYGDPDANLAYDTVTKEFTTGDNILTVDVVMCIDATGSMSGIINTVKENAISFYDAFNDKCIDNGIQLSGLNNKVIAFRDKNVDLGDSWTPVWWEESEYYALPEQKEEFDSFVSNLYADGGGDEPESSLEALMGAFEALENAIDDGYHRQVVILWTDANYLQGEEYTDLVPEDVLAKWNTLSSGRRLILFAPDPIEEWFGEGYNGGSWGVFDKEKNVIRSSNVSASFYDFDYILDSIIEELIGKGETKAAKVKSTGKTIRLKPTANK